MFGGVFGFTLGAAFVAIPFTSDVLTFGVIGTLVVAAVEGAVIAGAFAVCIAAFYGKGELYSHGARSGRSVPPVLSSEVWPGSDSGAEVEVRWPQSETLLAEPLAHSAQSARQWISTIDAWENAGALSEMHLRQ